MSANLWPLRRQVILHFHGIILVYDLLVLIAMKENCIQTEGDCQILPLKKFFPDSCLYLKYST